uniref:CSON010074 protein n=1 Tax=Culicoides sonorensis TaxID=179676 RepID=A0A336M1B5_CULSO
MKCVQVIAAVPKVLERKYEGHDPFYSPKNYACLAGYHEKRLLHDLLDSYNTLERPVVNESDPLQLSFGLTLMQIIDVINN